MIYYGVYDVETAYMLNEEKVILMTKASLYEAKEGKKKLKITRYFRHDYISMQLLHGWFFVTVSFALCAGLWAVCNMEYLLDNLHKMDLKSFGWTVFLVYVLTVAVYCCILYGVCSFRYYTARRSVGTYAQTLRKITDIYAREEKGAGPDSLTEETRHDSFT
ncbi:MAG: hypothetical protein KH452_06655 [Clostridiales bacterium]|nr:hypothetical protein [Clostridiales bacterium]